MYTYRHTDIHTSCFGAQRQAKSAAFFVRTEANKVVTVLVEGGVAAWGSKIPQPKLLEGPERNKNHPHGRRLRGSDLPGKSRKHQGKGDVSRKWVQASFSWFFSGSSHSAQKGKSFQTQQPRGQEISRNSIFQRSGGQPALVLLLCSQMSIIKAICVGIPDYRVGGIGNEQHAMVGGFWLHISPSISWPMICPPPRERSPTVFNFKRRG